MVAGPCNHERTTRKAVAFAVQTTTGKLAFFPVLSRRRRTLAFWLQLFRFDLFELGRTQTRRASAAHTLPRLQRIGRRGNDAEHIKPCGIGGNLEIEVDETMHQDA